MITPAELDELERLVRDGCWLTVKTDLSLIAEVRRLQAALHEAECKQRYYTVRLDAWESKAMTFERLLQDQGPRLSDYAKFTMQNAEEKFRTSCDNATEWLKARMQKRT